MTTHDGRLVIQMGLIWGGLALLLAQAGLGLMVAWLRRADRRRKDALAIQRTVRRIERRPLRVRTPFDQAEMRTKLEDLEAALKGTRGRA
jgi:hypothetical protein